jgi:gliding-associated putative ABC transporter substrate-binding component GldG
MEMNWFNGFFQDKRETAYQLLLLTGILFTVNVLAEELVVRFDLTEDNRYTLSGASEDIARSLTDPVTVTAYFSADLPPQLAPVEYEFRSFLEEFRAYADGNLEYEFVNPNQGPEAEQKARQEGIQPVMIDVRERDRITQKRAYFGAVFRYQGKKEVVPVVSPGAGLEYTIASTIRQLTMEDKPKIGLLQGHGEPGREELIQLMNELEQRYEVVEVAGLDTTSVPADIEALLVIAPDSPIAHSALQAIDQYIMAGGKAVFALNKIQTQVQFGMARPLQTGLDQLLEAYGLTVNANLVQDAQASAIQVQQQQGAFTFVNQIQYPFIPLVTNFGNHPISQGLETAVFQFISSLDTTRIDSSQTLTILASSSEQAGLVTPPFNLSPSQNWSMTSFGRANIPIAGLAEGVFPSAFAGIDSVDVALEASKPTSIVVFGDGDFIINGSGQQRQRMPADNISLMVNSIDWLADDTGLIALRTKGVTNRPLELVEDGTKVLIKYLNVFAPILLVLGYGFYRYQRNQIRRQRWMEEGV